MVADFQPLVRLLLDTRRWWSGEPVGDPEADSYEDRGWVHVDDQDDTATRRGLGLVRPFNYKH